MKNILIPFIALILSVNAYAQKPNKEKMKALKVAHITEELDLTAKEAQSFWPIYNEHEEARFKLRDNSVRNRLEELATSTSKTEITESEAKELLEKMSKIEETKYKLEKDYYKKLSSVLSSKKILKLFEADLSFRRKMIKEFKERHRREKFKRN